MSLTSRAERSKVQVEVSTETRRKLRLLAALTDVDMAQAADDAVTRRLAQVQEGRAGK